jgi:hypothetical protein
MTPYAHSFQPPQAAPCPCHGVGQVHCRPLIEGTRGMAVPCPVCNGPEVRAEIRATQAAIDREFVRLMRGIK